MISYHTCPLASEEGKETGGMNVYVLHTAKELAKQGFLVDIFTRSQNIDQPHIVHIAENLRLMHIKAGPESYILPNTEENKMNFLSYIPEFIDNIKAFQENESITYDVIDAHYYLSGQAGLELKKSNNNAPLIVTFHTLALMKNLVARNGLSEAEERRIEIETQLTKEADMVITPSENEKNYVEYLYHGTQSKIQVISPGVDTTLFHPMDKMKSKQSVEAELDHKMILFVGRIDPVKGLDVLLYAMRILFAKNPEMKACLWIVGGDVSQKPETWSKELQKLEQLQKLLGLHTTVKFVGQKHQHDLPKYYNAADLVVMPSHYESFGMTALEAMACGTPVLTTNVTGVSELLEEACQKHITTANNPLLMADAIKNILEHHHAHEDEELFETVKHYDWKNVAEKIASVYKKLLV
jgi:D-inositol-3-phosphate glycosyltransferase